MAPRIVVISESPALRGRLQEELEQDHYRVYPASSAGEGYGIARDARPQVIILDYAILVRDGTGLCARFKQDDVLGSATLMLLASEEKIKGFDFSVPIDDFLLAPLHTIELSARVRLAVSRATRPAPVAAVEIDGLVIDQAGRRVTLAGLAIALTHKEFELLWYLAAHRGRVCSRPALMAHVWNRPDLKTTRTLDIHIRRLRAKLGPVWAGRLRTVSGVGYRLDEPDAAMAPGSPGRPA